ncbi:Glycosyltransferase involved in cell wall bisynthesis [Tangfeifania diversioriginum]|uniref:Glycosyltransferase involved in cell wall bisynthesis n=1 Tax=Tangfeifania diversioriginum TaxID=1168035 RepID=A0A1M6HMT1_9BACT|nr:glycosyltransferase [Tangfeifania diversioriginum]SHJ23492.1 Glycosyltransferase involved in cell wall bisynthesis [Tangfeifania diversioriginum]
MPPEVSVILPFYNSGKTLAAAVESILQQTFRDFELLLIDNNSLDKSIAIAQKLAEKDHRIRLLSEEKQGVAHAMNCGLKNARGRFVARMDADDTSQPERLEKQVHFLRNRPNIGLVGCEVNYIAHEKNTAGFNRFVKWVNSFHSPEEIDFKRFVEIPVVNPTVLFRRDLYEKFGGCFHGDFPEDYEMQLRYLKAGVKMAKLPEPLLEWHDTPTRLTRTDDRYSTEAFFRTKAFYFKKWSEKQNRFHPDIWVWGAGRKTRQRAKLLEKEGLKIQGFIDIVKGKTTEKETLHFTEIPDPGKIFIVPMVTKTGARELIQSFLQKAGYKEGKDFIMMG